MGRKSIVFRCPEELVRQMDALCRRNGIDRTRLITCAVLSVIQDLSRQGLISPLMKEVLPPSPEAACNRMRRRHANT